MLQFILRRIGISLFVLWAGSVLLYILTINSGDPLQDLRESRAENRDQLIAARVEAMDLDEPWYTRYWIWFTGASKCLVLQCDLGTDRSGGDINTMLVQAAGSSLRLVTLATFLAIVLGVTMGLLSAIRQYSGFDYAVTFVAFIFFSLPVFWAAVLLKQYGAIGFNNWIADPTVSTITTLLLAIIFGLTVSAIAGGNLQPTADQLRRDHRGALRRRHLLRRRRLVAAAGPGPAADPAVHAGRARPAADADDRAAQPPGDVRRPGHHRGRHGPLLRGRPADGGPQLGSSSSAWPPSPSSSAWSSRC